MTGIEWDKAWRRAEFEAQKDGRGRWYALVFMRDLDGERRMIICTRGKRHARGVGFSSKAEALADARAELEEWKAEVADERLPSAPVYTFTDDGEGLIEGEGRVYRLRWRRAWYAEAYVSGYGTVTAVGATRKAALQGLVRQVLEVAPVREGDRPTPAGVAEGAF